MKTGTVEREEKTQNIQKTIILDQAYKSKRVGREESSYLQYQRKLT